MHRPHTRAWYALLASLFFMLSAQVEPLLRWLDMRRYVPGFLWVALRLVLEVAVVVLGLGATHRIGIRRAATELGLTAPIGRGLIFAFLAAAPMLLVFGVTSPINPALSPMPVIFWCIAAPFVEELVFRAFLFRQLYRRARLGFWLSVLIPSLLFGAGHLYQSNDPSELIGIFAVTGIGGALFCWLYMRWQDNFWPVFGLHALMNLWWEVFAVDDTALGGWLANAARLATVVVGVLLTIYKDRIWKPLPTITAASEAPVIEESPTDGHRQRSRAYPIARISVPGAVSPIFVLAGRDRLALSRHR